ncbi:MAG: hypothetical protein ACM3VS_05765 [Candidatus Dadabacteria bacterium]
MDLKHIPTQLIIIILLSVIVFLIAVYYVVAAAMKKAIREIRIATRDQMVHEAIRLSNRLKIQDLLLRGVHPDRIKELQDLSNNPFD